MTMSKTAALKISRRVVHMPQRMSPTNYVVRGPYYANQPSGPTTEVNYPSYPRAMIGRARWVVDIAVRLMGHTDYFVRDDVYPATVENMLSATLKQF